MATIISYQTISCEKHLQTRKSTKLSIVVDGLLGSSDTDAIPAAGTAVIIAVPMRRPSSDEFKGPMRPSPDEGLMSIAVDFNVGEFSCRYKQCRVSSSQVNDLLLMFLDVVFDGSIRR